MLLSSPGLAVDPAGQAVAVNPQATGALQGAVARTLTSGDGVFLGQTVVTGNVGEVQIVFSDDTHLVVGPNATLVIAEYLMRNNTTASKVVINALGGTFRFMTGDSPKNAYQINTPTGTMGVRGTAFDFTVAPPGLARSGSARGATSVLLYHGAVRLCAQGSCKTLAEECDIGVMPGNQPTSILSHSDRKRTPFVDDFPYLASQTSLKTDFRLSGIRPCRQVQKAGPLTAERNVQTVAEIDPAPADPVTPPEEEADSGHDNNGIGNGGDSASEGESETGNKGQSNAGGNGNGNAGGNGNGNGNGRKNK